MLCGRHRRCRRRRRRRRRHASLTPTPIPPPPPPESSSPVGIGTFDSGGVVWRFTLKSPPVDGIFLAIMECHELGEKPLGLTKDLDLTSDTSKCGEWLIQSCEAFRGDPLDISVTIRSSIDGRYLCSSEDQKKVTLLTKHDADVRDATGNYQYNIAWECSPELHETGDLGFLDKYMNETPSNSGTFSSGVDFDEDEF